MFPNDFKNHKKPPPPKPQLKWNTSVLFSCDENFWGWILFSFIFLWKAHFFKTFVSIRRKTLPLSVLYSNSQFLGFGGLWDSWVELFILSQSWSETASIRCYHSLTSRCYRRISIFLCAIRQVQLRTGQAASLWTVTIVRELSGTIYPSAPPFSAKWLQRSSTCTGSENKGRVEEK